MVTPQLANGFASFRVRGLLRDADRRNVKLTIGGRVNARVSPTTPLGKQELRLQFGDLADSTPLTIAP
jgi:hypothetical protein